MSTQPPIPASVRLLGQSFAIELVDRDDAVLGGAAVDMERVGTVHITKQRISIAKDMASDQERDTVLHEVLHALIRVINLMPKEQEEERIVVALAPLILDALRRNPNLVEYLVGGAEERG